MRKSNIKIVSLPDAESYQRLAEAGQLIPDAIYLIGGGVSYEDLDEHMKDILRAKADKNSVNNALGVLELDMTNAKNDIIIAQDTAELANNKAQENAATKYEKPPDGIPEDDLTAAVQAKLNSGGGSVTPEQIAAAVEAYMAAHPITENDPTVPAWAKQPNKPSYTADEVGAEQAAMTKTRGEVVMFGLNGRLTASGIPTTSVATKADIENAIAVIDGIADDIMGITEDILEVL